MSHTKTNLWWGPPRNFDERKNERKISWLELFYDLVYVAAISQLTQHFAAYPSWPVLAFGFLLFSMIFWSWINGSQYYDLHGSDSIRTRLFTFMQMLAVAAVTITIEDAFNGYHKAFAITFSAIQIIITYLWWSVGFYDRSHRVFNKFYTFNYVIAFILLIVSAFLNFHTAVILWIIVLVLDLTPSLTGARTIIRVLKERGQVFSASAALVERFGLFTIIVLTESVLGTVTGIAKVKDQHPIAWVGFITGILIAFLLWSIYFDMTSEQETKKGYQYLQWLIFLHFPLLASLGIVGASIKIILADIETAVPSIIQWMFCISLSIILLMTVCITAIMEEHEEDRSYIKPVSRLLVVIAGIVSLVPAAGKFLNAISFLLIIALLLFVPVFIGIKSWVRYKFFSGNK